MAIGSPQWMYSSGTGDFEIERSLRCNRNDSASLSRTPSSAGNRKSWTFSTWVKRGKLVNNEVFIAAAGTGNSGWTEIIRFDPAGTLTFSTATANTVGGRLTTTDVYEDTASWYHIVCVWDSANSTASDRIRLYVNGSRVSNFNNETLPSQNLDSLFFNNNVIHKIAVDTYANTKFFDGYIAETHFIDGQSLNPTAFGETGDYGEWKPIEYTGSYGSNGYYLDYKDSGAGLDNDKSGNNNNFTASNFRSDDRVLDTPTNNFSVMNAMRPGCSNSFREGNLYLRDSGNAMGVSTMLPKTGKWYWEVDPQDRYAGTPEYGIATEIINNQTEIGSGSSRLDGVKINAYAGGNQITIYGTGSLHGSTGPWTSDYIWGFALDNDNGKLWISRNGDWTHVLSGGNPSTATNPTASGLPTAFPTFGYIGSDSTTYNAYIRVNFGADGTFFGNQTSGGYSDDNGYGDFKYEVPSGFLSICAKNLPEPDVVPTEHFNTVLWTGNGTTGTNITNVGFAPSLTWLKGRDIASDPHQLYDTVRGATKSLKANATDAEITRSTGLTAFGTDGFTIGNHAYVNRNTSIYVSWNWKANGSGSSNTNGNITSTVSANQDAGFSVVKWTHDGGSNPRTIGHGLSKAPQFMLMKHINSTSNWYVMHQDLASTQEMELNNSAAVQNGSDFGSVAPTASVFSTSTTGVSGRELIAYCWHEVEGYSSFGEFDGNNVNYDGPFIYTGFEPAFLLVKATHGSYSWMIADDKRSPNNFVSKIIYPNESSVAEETWTSPPFLFTSNGFKINYNHPSINGSSGHYIYAAFAKTPQKYSNAR